MRMIDILNLVADGKIEDGIKMIVIDGKTYLLYPKNLVSASKHYSANEYFMMYRSLQAVFTYLVEVSFAAFTVLPMVHLSSSDWFAAIAIILSSFAMILMRGRRGQALLKTLNKKE